MLVGQGRKKVCAPRQRECGANFLMGIGDLVGKVAYKYLQKFAMSEEEKKRITDLIYDFIGKTEVEVECNRNFSDCYHEAHAKIADIWNEFERATGLYVDRMDGHCSGWVGEYYGVFRDLYGGCKPLAVLREEVYTCGKCLKLRYVPIKWYI